MPPSDQYYTLKQFRIDLQRMVDFCSTTLSRKLSNEERTYYSARKFALISYVDEKIESREIQYLQIQRG